MLGSLVDQCPCPVPACFEGKTWGVCASCEGNGCALCEDKGLTDLETCELCEGTSTVTVALAELYEAAERVRESSPDWDGDNRVHPGITLYSEAEYFRRRNEFRGRVTMIGGVRPASSGAVVTLYQGEAALARFTGFEWGYSGEGPRGLAAVLADIGVFPTLKAAVAFALGVDATRGWLLSVAGDANEGGVR